MEPVREKNKPGRPRAPGRRGEGGGGIFAALAMLGFIARVSPYVASTVARATTLLGSHEEAAESLTAQGLELHPDAVRRIANDVADAGLADRESTNPIDNDFAGKRVVIGADGGRLRCRVEKAGRCLASGYHGFETPWHEPKLFSAYVIDEEGEAVRGQKPVYEGSLAPWKNTIEIAATTLRRHGIQHATQVAIAADGSDNIWREADRFIELLGIERSRVVLYVDFYHAHEHLHDVAGLTSCFTTDAQREQWIAKQARRLKRGRVEAVIEEMASLPTANSEAAEELLKECEYFRSRKELMRYDQLQKAGLPLGTGGVESTVRRVVNLRMKGPGIFWTPENAERLLYLRCRAKTGRWDEVESAMHRAALVPSRSNRPAVLDLVAGLAA
jgi:hypothetical protein